VKIDDVITKLNLRQSAFCIEIFDAEIQIPETSLQALPFFLPSRHHTRESLLAGYMTFIVDVLSSKKMLWIYNLKKRSFNLLHFQIVLLPIYAV